jgi:dihydroxy-acid dehydratase
LQRRRAAWTPPPARATGGYQKLYIEHVLQAHQGADLDFLTGCRGADVPRESH